LFEEHEGELQHLPWPEQSPDLNTTEPHWSVFETGPRNGLPPPASLKELEEVLQEEFCKISLESVQNLYESITKRTADMVQHNINKEMFCSVRRVWIHLGREFKSPTNNCIKQKPSLQAAQNYEGIPEGHEMEKRSTEDGRCSV
jgi:hypothetical protein